MNRMVLEKVLIGLVFILALFSHHAFAENSLLDLTLELTGYLLLVIAAFGRTWSSAYISGKKNRTLVMDGPYSIVRNPLYFFSLAGFTGVGLAFESIELAIMCTGIFFLTHWPAILEEEARLAELFGAEFTEYRNQVPRLLPEFSLLKNPDSVAMSPAIFSRALLESSLIMLVYIVAEIVEWGHLQEHIPVIFRLY